MQSNNQDNNVDPFSSPEDKSPSFQGERVDVDEHYNQQPDGSYIKKDTSYQKSTNQENNNTILIVVILIVSAGIIGALALNQKKPVTGVVALKNSLIQCLKRTIGKTI